MGPLTISIHALLAESDGGTLSDVGNGILFLSTLSLRRATCYQQTAYFFMSDFYPRSPCGERRKYHRADRGQAYISIHALLAESDNGHEQASYRVVISIHALLAESDLIKNRIFFRHNLFLSTLSLRRATDDNGVQGYRTLISIHALLAESDFSDLVIPSDIIQFLSTLSLRRATAIDVFLAVWAVISIHALLAESDNGPLKAGQTYFCISIHALLAESDSLWVVLVR